MTWRDRGWVLVIAGTMLAVVGCGDDDGTGGADGGGGGGIDGGGGEVDGGGAPVDSGTSGGDEDAGPLPDVVTYYEHVRPILAEHCVGCHVDGGVAPFALDTYEAADLMATRIAEVTRARIMPPWLADNSGDCHTWQDARWLTEREIATLEAWDAMDEPMGDPATPAPTVPPLPELTGSVTTIQTADYTPNASANDDYRCFVVDGPTADTFLTGYEVHPGNDAIVHHVIVYAPTDAGAANNARTLDANEAGDGYTCFGASRVNAYPVVLWAPGGGATLFPEGTGVPLTGGLPLIIQVHYNVLGGDGGDQTTVELQTANSATRARIVPLGDYDMAVEGGRESVSTSHTEDLADLTRGFTIPLTVYGMFPHMHTLGRELRVDHIAAGGAEQCLVDVPRWDFNWQLAYFYETPVEISSADSLRITCSYDTRGRSGTVTWGEGTEDEMCLNFFYVVIGSGL